MKMKFMLFGAATVVALAASWFGSAAWRAHHQLVTLHVRNAPLAEVIRQMERQTHQKIRFDQKLDAKISLDVKSIPLAEALDSISEQAGARWGRTYAVYSSERALRSLESALQGGSELGPAGWTNIAPRFDDSMLVPPAEFGSTGPGKLIIRAPSSGNGASTDPNGTQIISDEDVREGATVTRNEGGTIRTVIKPGGGRSDGKVIKIGPGGTTIQNDEDVGTGHQPRKLTVRRVAGPGGITTTLMDGDGRVKVTKTAPDGALLKEDTWSSERLVIETSLRAQLGEATPSKATPETAAQAARKVRGKYSTYYTLDKPPIPGVEAMGGLARAAARSAGVGGGTNHLDMSGVRGRVEAEAKQRRLDELSKSPEQQVQRSRQKQQMQSGQ